MKMTVDNILRCLVTLSGTPEDPGLALQSLPIKAALPLRKTLNSLREEWKILVETQKEIAGREDGPGKDEAFEEFGKSEVEVKVQPVSVTDLGNKVRATPDGLTLLIGQGILTE